VDTREEKLFPIPQTDLRSLLPGLPRGAITEITGPRSSGRTALIHSLLAASTTAGEVSAVVDCNDSFDPASAHRAGSDLGKLLWVQCGGRLDHAMKSADLILHGGGFGLVVLDLCETPPAVLQRIPLSYWYRFQRAVASTPTVLVVEGSQPNAKAAAVRQLEMGQGRAAWQGRAGFQLLGGVKLLAGLRKPVRPESVTLWASAVGDVAVSDQRSAVGYSC
jgi:hypothetical protein